MATKMIEASEIEDAERAIRAVGMDPAEFGYVRAAEYPTQGVGPLKITITVSRGKTAVDFDGATWVTDFEQALKQGVFK